MQKTLTGTLVRTSIFSPILILILLKRPLLTREKTFPYQGFGSFEILRLIFTVIALVLLSFDKFIS